MQAGKLLVLVAAAPWLFGQPKPDVFVQLGHSSEVASVTFSPDGRYALSGSGDRTLKLWEIATGREVRTFSGHGDQVKSAAFSPDGQYALSGSSDETLKLWEVSTGHEVRTLSGHSKAVNAVAFSPDGRFAVSGSSDDVLKLWEVATGREVRTFSGHSMWVSSVAFSPDGQYVLSGSGDRMLKLWEVASGREVRTFSGHNDSVNSVAFSPDGQSALSASSDHTLKLWDVGTGREIRTLSGHDKWVSSVAFSPDGRQAVSASWDATARIWDVATGRQVRSLSGDSIFVASVAFSPDGRYVLVGNLDECVNLWDVATGREVRTLSGRNDWVHSVSFSPDGRYVLSGSNSTVKLWEVATGRQVRTFPNHNDRVSSVAFSPDGRYALSGHVGHTLTLWEVATGREIRTFAGHSKWVNSVAFSPDGRYALSGSGDHTLKLWEVASGREVRTFSGHMNQVSSVAFSPDGQYALSGSWDKSLKLWDVATGREVRTVSGYTNWVYSVAFSPDGRYLLGSDGTLKLWEVATGREVRTLSGNERTGSVAFSPDGRYVLYGSAEDVKLRATTGRELATLVGHAGFVRGVGFSPDGRFLLSGGDDGTIRIWSATTFQPLVELAGFRDGEWIAITPEGYYAASPSGDQRLNVRVGASVYGVDQWRQTLYQPRVVERAIELGDSSRAIGDVLGPDRRPEALNQAGASATVRPGAPFMPYEPPFVVIRTPEDGARLPSRDVTVSIYAEDRLLPLRSAEVTVNGRAVTRKGSGQPEGRLLTLAQANTGRKVADVKVPLTLDAGENRIEVAVSNGTAETRKAITVFAEGGSPAGETLPNLWILAIGVNRYDHPKIRALEYAAADAVGIVKAFEKQRGKLFRDVHSLVIADGQAVAPTRDNIIDNLEHLSKAGQRDVILLFLAGHGTNDERGDFYFAPRDAGFQEDGTLRKSRAISWRELAPVLDLPARKLVFVDTCHSQGLGGPGGAKARAVDSDRLVRELREFGAVVFASSRGMEMSQEMAKLGHGVFTYALIQGMSGDADLIKDGKVSMKELDTYVSETVPKLTNGAQHPITITPEGYLNFPVALVE